jgi:hypothetical protein
MKHGSCNESSYNRLLAVPSSVFNPWLFFMNHQLRTNLRATRLQFPTAHARVEKAAAAVPTPKTLRLYKELFHVQRPS